MPADIPALVAEVARALTDHPDDIEVTTATRGRRGVVRLKVAPGDMGRIIGREGRVANALRTLLSAAPEGAQWSLEIRE